MKGDMKSMFLLKDEHGSYVGFFDQFLAKAQVTTLIFPIFVLIFYYVEGLMFKDLNVFFPYREQRLPVAVTLWFGIHVISHCLGVVVGKMRKDIRRHRDIIFGCMLILMDVLVFLFI